jgi:hypothetical protein
LGILDDGVAAGKNGEGAELAQSNIERLKTAARLPEAIAHGAKEALLQGFSRMVAAGEAQAEIVGLQAPAGVGKTFSMNFQEELDGATQGEIQFVETLCAARDSAMDQRSGAVDTTFMKRSCTHGDAVTKGLQHLAFASG